MGAFALVTNTSGTDNTALGKDALFSNSTGVNITAVGSNALLMTTGGSNTAVGAFALDANTSGSGNTALGPHALGNSTTGNANIAIGSSAGGNATTGSGNIYIGNVGVAAEGFTIRIGNTQTKAFIAGIRSVSTGNANAIAVLVDSEGQLGTVSSSRRFKEDIQDMGETSNRLLQLRPVTFRYKQAQNDGSQPLQYGLIAEEVAEVFPELAVHDESGQPETVLYHVLPSLLLNELQRQEAKATAQEAEIAVLIEAAKEQQAQIRQLQAEMEALKAHSPVQLSSTLGMEKR